MKWPSKEERQAWEIAQFLAAYRKEPGGCSLEVLEERDKPDYFVQEVAGDRRYGVELTSVYLHDRSVPDVHMDDAFDWLNLPYDAEELHRYEQRLVEAVAAKLSAARTGYDLRYPLLLSVYVNEYISKYLSEERWSEIQEGNWRNDTEIHPFQAIIFWNLPNGRAFIVSPA